MMNVAENDLIVLKLSMWCVMVVTWCEGGKIKLYKFDAAAAAPAPPSLKRRVGARS